MLAQGQLEALCTLMCYKRWKDMLEKKSLRKTGLYSNVALEHFHCSQVGFY